ncbi:MAG: hypothetical protein KDA24_14900 [Deltaproteobacteria bacterium]|nr:hypothetical protein [Deltaproteobacteria bacterium]
MATCRRIARALGPQRIVVCSLQQSESEAAIAELAAEHPEVEWVADSGNLFVPTEFAGLGRGEMLGDPAKRARLLAFTFGPIEDAYASNHLALLIRKHQPDAIVDCVNTATGISYQDVWESTATLQQELGDMQAAGGSAVSPEFAQDLETSLLAQAMPQIIRHVRLLSMATTEVGTSIYVKVGTTGTGGMGLNIPYTHSEDRPSKQLLAKNAVAFSHTGLLFLLARTPDGPVVKEVKPGAMIGYRAVEVRTITDRTGTPKPLYEPRTVDGAAASSLPTRLSPAEFTPTGEELCMTVVNTGENGLFAKGEFAAITALSQMEFVTPEEIARAIVTELTGGSTGYDIISALDSTVMEPSYRAGLLRHVALKDLTIQEGDHGVPSIALGDLGPPELSKLLFEAWLIQDTFGDRFLSAVVDEGGAERSAQDVADAIASRIGGSLVARQAVSIGIPILMPDGSTFLRGPVIKVPEIKGRKKVADLTPEALDTWARRGWIDLRPSNMTVWQNRFGKMDAARQELARKGSAAVSRETYLPATLKIGDVVAWILNNEMSGYRIK